MSTGEVSIPPAGAWAKLHGSVEDLSSGSPQGRSKNIEVCRVEMIGVGESISYRSRRWFRYEQLCDSLPFLCYQVIDRLAIQWCLFRLAVHHKAWLYVVTYSLR